MRKSFDSDVSLLELSRKKKKKSMDEWTERAKSGEQMRIF